MEKAFFQFEVEVVQLSDFQDIRDRSSVVVEVGVGGDSDVVHVDTDSCPKWFMFENDIVIDVVHHGLEGCWQVRESKIHDRGLEKSVSGFKRCFLLISLADANIVVPPSDVEFCIYMCVAEVTNEVCDKREGVLIPNCEGVDLSVVLYRSHFAILFLDEEKR